MATDSSFRTKEILKNYHFVDVELAETNYPLAEDLLEDENHILGTLAYSENAAYAEFKVENLENDAETLFKIPDITELQEKEDGVYIETEDYYWSFLFEE